MGIDRSRLGFLTDSNDNYHVFDKLVRDKLRTIETPKPILAKVHSRLFELLVAIEAPDYLHSGRRGRSYVTNAKAHDPLLAGFKIDVKGFYPSTTTAHVASAFRNQFRCSDTVAQKLAAIATIDGHVPTGSQVSQILVFHTHRLMFDAINEICLGFGGVMTLYVDDLYISIPQVRRWHIRRIGRVIRKQGLDWHKERVYKQSSPKLITGVVHSSAGTLVPNSKHLRLRKSRQQLRESRTPTERLETARSIAGQLTSGSVLDKRLEGRAKSARGFIRHLQRRR